MTYTGTLTDRLNYEPSGWRLFAYWLAVMFAGVTLGIRYGHPDLSVLPWGVTLGVEAPSKPTAARAARYFSYIALALLVVVVGREAMIDSDAGGEDA